MIKIKTSYRNEEYTGKDAEIKGVDEGFESDKLVCDWKLGVEIIVSKTGNFSRRTETVGDIEGTLKLFCNPDDSIYHYVKESKKIYLILYGETGKYYPKKGREVYITNLRKDNSQGNGIAVIEFNF